MKALDVVGTGVKAAVAAVAAALAPAPKAPSRDAVEELRRRARINAEAAVARAEREAALFGSSRWVARRPGRLERGR